MNYLDLPLIREQEGPIKNQFLDDIYKLTTGHNN
jgi:hypothetical protein